MNVNELKKVYVDVSSSNDELSDSSDVSQMMLNDRLKTLLPNETTSLVCKKLAAELNILQYKNLKIKKEKNDEKEKNSILKLNLHKINLVKENEIAIINAKLERSEAKREECERTIEKLNKELESKKEKVFNYETMKEKLKDVVQENTIMRENLEKVNKLNKTLIEDCKKKDSDIELITVQRDDYKKERVFILNENLILKEKNKELKEALEERDKKIKEINEEKEKLNKVIIQYEQDKENEINERLMQLKEQYNNELLKEINKTKESVTTYYESKVKYLTEQNIELKDKNAKQIKNTNNALNTNDSLSLETSKQINILKDEISSLNINLKVKEEDINRIQKLYENNYTLIEVLSNENSSLKEKIKVYKEELINQKKESCDKLNLFKEENARLKEENKNYSQIESEIEKIICDSTILSVDDDFAKIISEIPTNSKKRVNQVMLLSHRLKDFADALHQLTNENNILQTELNKSKEENKVLVNLNAKIKQPYEYLLIQMQKKDDLISNLSSMNEDLNKKIKSLLEYNASLEKKSSELENDIKTILTNRKKIDDLDYIVKSYIAQEKEYQYKKKHHKKIN